MAAAAIGPVIQLLCQGNSKLCVCLTCNLKITQVPVRVSFVRSQKKKQKKGQRITVHFFLNLLLIFIVTPFWINQNNNQNCSIDKVQNREREKKEGNYASTLAKIQVTANFLMEDMRTNFLPKFIDLYGDAMQVPILLGTIMAAGNHQKNLSLSFATKEWIYVSRNSKTIR